MKVGKVNTGEKRQIQQHKIQNFLKRSDLAWPAHGFKRQAYRRMAILYQALAPQLEDEAA